MRGKRIKPDQCFSVERDGFFGEYYRAKDNAFPGKCIIAFGGSVETICRYRDQLKEHAFPHRFESHIYPHLGHFILPVRPYSSALFISERKYKKECAAERKQSWEDTLAFLRAW